MIYLDMDGTIVKEEGPYNTREWLPGMKDLTMFLSRLHPHGLAYLTQIPDNNLIPSWQLKQEWVQNHTPHIPLTVALKSIGKWPWSTRGRLLVDNDLNHMHKWTERGGAFIHFHGANDLAAHLRSLRLLP